MDSDHSVKSGKVHNFAFNRKERDFLNFTVQSCQVQFNPTISNSVTATDIQTLAPYVWIDLEDKTKISPANITAGQSITSCVSKGSGPIVTYSSANGLLYDSFLNSNAAAIHSTVNWHYMADSTQPNNPGQGTEGMFTFMFQTPAVISGWHWLVKNRVFRIQASTVLRLVEDITIHQTNIALQVSTPYLCQVIWDGTDMKAEVWDLTQPSTSQTDTVAMPNNLTPTPNYNFYFPGNAQTGFINYKVGGCIELQTKSPTAALTCINYYKQLYSGTAQQTTSDTPTSLVLCSEFLTNCRTGKSLTHEEGVELLSYRGELNSEPYYSLNHEGKRWNVDIESNLREIDIYFVKPDGTVVDVTHFSMSVDLQNDIAQL